MRIRRAGMTVRDVASTYYARHRKLHERLYALCVRLHHSPSAEGERQADRLRARMDRLRDLMTG